MAIDPVEELVVDPPMEQRENITIINPDKLDDGPTEPPTMPIATDHDAMRQVILPPLLEDPRVLDDVVYTWEVEQWRHLNKKEHSPAFQAGGYPWRILLFPFGNNVDQCSVYLEHGFEPDTMPSGWSCCVHFALVFWNPNDPSIFMAHHAHHRFTKDESDWGFTRFVEIQKMFTPFKDSDRPLVEGECLNVTAYVRVVEDETGVLWHNFNNYDSKEETGFVGLKNQGATCYLNSLLQSLYFTNAFRKAIYSIPTEQDASMANSAYTLQRLFYQLQTSNLAVGTNELTKSFGWETRHIFEQQDVQELSRKLMERMEEKMKGTEQEKTLLQMFSGKIKTYISCINVPYESSRIEDFWDVQLNVSGNKNLLDSFHDYIQVEKLDGENQYFAGEEYKLQDAHKGVIFMSFPNVLHLQLKRFEYDIQFDTMTKINDRYEFPEEFDAAPFLDKDADRFESWEYQLHGVLVHSGDLNTGHYYAFLKPEKAGWWYKYDDDKVTKATRREVLEENFGGEYRSPLPNHLRAMTPVKKTPIMRPNSAYMLVYIRKAKLDEILTPVTAQDIPQHLQYRFELEIAAREARRKEREEQHLYLSVKAITQGSFEHHDGTDLAVFDNIIDGDPAAPRMYRVLRASSMQDLVELIASDIGQDSRRVRVWVMVNRQNKTIRPDQPQSDLRCTVEELYNRGSLHRDHALRLWVEVAEEVNEAGETIWPNQHQVLPNGGGGPVTAKTDLILLFLKCFDVERQALRGVGHVYINREKRVEDLVPLIAQKMGWGETLDSEDKILIWEEIKPSMIEPLKGKQTLRAAELQDGDIVCFQGISPRHPPSDLDEKGAEEAPKLSDRYENAKDYYDFLLHKRALRLCAHPTKCDSDQYPPSDIVLNGRLTYDKFAEKIGERLDVDPTHLRFYTINSSTNTPRATVKRAPNQTLAAILSPSSYARVNPNQRSDALYFEVLDISLAELDLRKTIKLVWLSEGVSKEDNYDLLVPKNGTVQDVIDALVQKANLLSEEEAGKIRIYETSGHKFLRELKPDIGVVHINDYSSVVAERIPEEELDDREPGFYMSVFQFHNEPTRTHGVPFKFWAKTGEPFSETKKRLEKRTGFKGKSFEKIKFALLQRTAYARLQYLQDGDVLSDYARPEDYLGLDHIDRGRGLRNVADLFLKG